RHAGFIARRCPRLCRAGGPIDGGLMPGSVRRVVPLTFGWEELPKSVSVHGADPSIRLREPVPGVLCQVDGGWLLLDTGFNDPLIRDPALMRRFHGTNHGIEAVLPGAGE